MLEIYEIGESRRVWDMPPMAKRADKKESAIRSARAIADRLATILGDGSERQWTMKAGVSPSFFSNLRGTPTKDPSDPGVDQLRQILKARGVTLAEFFLDESAGAVVRAKSRRDVEQAFADALKALPSKAADRPRYLATTVAKLLGLPATLPAIPTGQGVEEMGGQAEVALPQLATKRKAS